MDRSKIGKTESRPQVGYITDFWVCSACPGASLIPITMFRNSTRFDKLEQAWNISVMLDMGPNILTYISSTVTGNVPWIHEKYYLLKLKTCCRIL